jgi:anthranilate phosphoribosyltransferase
MPFTSILRRIVAGSDARTGLDEAEAYALFCAMLDGGVPDLELGAILLALRQRGETNDELAGFVRAVDARLYRVEPPDDRVRPVVIGAYGGARDMPNLLALLVMLLQRLGIPTLVHGTLEGGGRVATAYVLRELGVMPCATLRQAEDALAERHLAFVPTAALCPGLAGLLALKSRLGVRTAAHTVARLLSPFGPDALQLVSAGTPDRLEQLAEVLAAGGGQALLLRGTEGEPVASALRRPRIDHIADGVRQVLFEEEGGSGKAVHGLVASIDAASTATWIRRALAGETPLPHPIVNQLACCLFAVGYTEDMNQAKAIAAVEAGALTPSRSAGRLPPGAPASAR